MQYFVMWTKIDLPVNFLTPVSGLSENTQTYYKIYSLLLPIYTTATAVKAVYKFDVGKSMHRYTIQIN